ncbi:MAG: DUF4214 domain-containing protein [Sulfitobacter sp.]
MPNITWTVSEVVDGSAGAISAEQSTAVQNLLIAAGETWEKYLKPAQPITFEIKLEFTSAVGGLAEAGPGNLLGQNQDVGGLPLFEAVTITELKTGQDPEAAVVDISVKLPISLENQFFETDVVNRNSPIPAGQFDLYGTLLHELGHALGFIGFRGEKNNGILTAETGITAFDALFNETDLVFQGQATTALLGGINAPITPNNFNHLGDANAARDTLSYALSQMSLLAKAGEVVNRSYITPLEVAVLQDVGVPINLTTAGDDVLSGFDPLNLSEFFTAEEIGNLPQIVFALSDGADALSGGGGNDVLAGLRGNDALDGGAGVDTAVFAGTYTSHTLTIGPGTTTLTDRSGTNGTDTLTAIELLDFDVDMGGAPFDLAKFGGLGGLNATDLQSFIELYIAYLNRAPDAVGLSFWGTAFANGTSLEATAKLFIDQEETRALYAADLSNTDFARAVYNNVLGREADQAGFDFWVGSLDNNTVGRDTFILAILGGAKAPPPPDATPEFVAQQQADQAYLSNKTDIGTYFGVTKGMSNTQNATNVMQAFDGSQESITQAVNATDAFFASASGATDGEFLMQIVGILPDPFIA